MAIKLSLVIPTYNEAANIAVLCQKLINVLNTFPFNCEIIVVDDDSPDSTYKIVEELALQDARIKVFRRTAVRGLAQAVVYGWNNCRGEIIGVMDGDLQHPAELLKTMLNQMLSGQEIDIVIASRYVAGGGILVNSLWQKIRSALAIFLGSIFLPEIFKSVKDPMSGYFILRKEVIAGRKLDPLGYKILLEVLVIGKYRKIAEVPYLFGRRLAGVTKAGLKECLFYLAHLLRLKKSKK
ncbi:MAG: polyprenol monophosphomannose synthase [Candidatus Omnitrophica bacterium]|nr:polyprenol monophosphomannose synthase [Candidatus Omnitrophota bacterium]